MDQITQEDLTGIGELLGLILQNDNEIRKDAEAKLNQAKLAATDKYALILATVIHPNSAQFSLEAKSLAAVILRRNISITDIAASDITNQENNANIWLRITDQTRQAMKQSILETLDGTTAVGKSFTHKVCNLAVEIQGAITEHQDDAIWQELLNLLFTHINCDTACKIDAALQIFNGLFSHIMDHLVKYKDDLAGIFQKTLQNPTLDIKLAALQATANYLSIAERKETKAFIPLLPLMVTVITAALAEEDETVLEDALVEFNELAEIEPSFFKPNFKEIYEALKPVVANKEFANNSIRHQPLEFFCTIIERQPSIVKKDEALLRDLLEQVFHLMIDIDEDIDQSWLVPKEGHVDGGEDEEEDNVAFGKGLVDRLVAGIGDVIMLPLIGTLVQNTIANDTDWRYKHAGIMAFSQVGEYVDDTKKIEPMVPVLLQHLQHPNPKIRYASLHCIGQIADDMPNNFQKAFHESVLPALIASLDDDVPRVASHACAAITNFAENASSEIIMPQLQVLSQKFCNMIKNGISIVKENAATAMATVVEQVGEEFIPYYQETLQFMLNGLSEYHQPEYKQFRGQVIEAITIICAAVGKAAFAPTSNDVIGTLLQIQNTQLERKDAQRIYLLTAWQRLCILMGEDFGPYLPQILPGVFTMATLSPSMGVQGMDTIGALTDVLKEVKTDTGDGKAINIVTDEIEEKDVAIQMLAVFIDEVGVGVYDFIQPMSEVLLSMTQFTANDSIRSTCASSLPGLIKAMKQKDGCVTPQLHEIAKKFFENIHDAMQEETETDTLIAQVTAFKDIIDEVGPGLLTQQQVEYFGEKAVGMVDKSLARIEENNKVSKEEPEDEDDELDAEDLALLKEENNNEHDLQLAAAELMGALFKNHKDFVGPLVQKLRSETLVSAFTSNEQKRLKFAIFILDDMVEHLGPAYFSAEDFNAIVQTVCGFSGSQSASLRQASAYGIGVVAEHGGEAFASCADLCLTSLKSAIDFAMTPKVEAKQMKVTQYHHARDNAIASIGKILKFRQSYINSNPQVSAQLVQYWLGLLPITHDTEEAQSNYEYLCDFILEQPQFIFGSGDPAATARQLATIYGEAFQEQYWAEGKTAQQKEKMALAVRYLMNQAPSPVPESFKAACENVLSKESREHIEAAFNFQ